MDSASRQAIRTTLNHATNLSLGAYLKAIKMILPCKSSIHSRNAVLGAAGRRGLSLGINLPARQSEVPRELLGLLPGIPGLRQGVEARIRKGQARPKDRQVRARPTAEALQDLRGVPDMQAREEQGLLRRVRREEDLRGLQEARGEDV